MQNLEEKVDIMLQNQEDIQRSIRNIQQVEIDMLKTQGDILRTQYKMQEEIYTLEENQKIMKEDIFYLKANQNVIGQDILNLDKKVDKNKKEISDRLDENLYEISEIFKKYVKD